MCWGTYLTFGYFSMKSLPNASKCSDWGPMRAVKVSWICFVAGAAAVAAVGFGASVGFAASGAFVGSAAFGASVGFAAGAAAAGAAVGVAAGAQAWSSEEPAPIAVRAEIRPRNVRRDSVKRVSMLDSPLFTNTRWSELPLC